MSTSSRSTARPKSKKASGKGVFGNIRFSCVHCGKELDRMTVTLFGKPTEVPCYGSCGCEESKWDGLYVRSEDREYARAGIPQKYLKAECDLGGRQQDVLGGRSLYIHGPFGSGKTYFACALTKALLNLGETVRFENSRHLITEIQGSYSGKYTDALDRAYACRVLVLDDLGKEQVTEYSISMLYELIDSRYAAGKQLVVTSNFSRDKLLERWAAADYATAESIVSRLCEDTDVMVMQSRDRRLT